MFLFCGCNVICFVYPCKIIFFIYVIRVHNPYNVMYVRGVVYITYTAGTRFCLRVTDLTFVQRYVIG